MVVAAYCVYPRSRCCRMGHDHASTPHLHQSSPSHHQLTHSRPQSVSFSAYTTHTCYDVSERRHCAGMEVETQCDTHTAEHTRCVPTTPPSSSSSSSHQHCISNSVR